MWRTYEARGRCYVDGIWRDQDGGEHYWRCDEQAVVDVPGPDILVCQYHSDTLYTDHLEDPEPYRPWPVMRPDPSLLETGECPQCGGKRVRVLGPDGPRTHWWHDDDGRLIRRCYSAG
jgi:hypothetical protein